MAAVKLTSGDKDALLAYIAEEPEVNLYISGDVEAFGMEEPVCVSAFVSAGGERAVGVLGDGDGLGDDVGWDAVVLDLNNNFVVYSKSGSFDAEEVADYIRGRATDGVPRHINARGDIAERLAPFFGEPQRCTLASCRKIEHGALRPLGTGYEVRRMGADDYRELFELLLQIDESSQHYVTAEEIEQAIERKVDSDAAGCMTYGAYENGRLLATAATSAASSTGAMLTGVATLPEARGRGLATAVVAQLCDDCFAAGLEFVALYFYNPAAARIYHRIGFTDLGTFGMITP